MHNLIAVCHNCQKRHAITAEQFLNSHALWDWEMKHRGHRIEFLDEAAYGQSIARNAVGEYRHNADIKIAYAADADYTITLASLAEDATLLTGVESNSVSNTTNLYLDYMISGRITVGTSPTTVGDEVIEVLAVGSEDDTPTWPDVFDGTGSAETISNANIKASICRYVARIQADDGTSDVDYGFGPVSLAQLFGVCPTNHLIFVTHSTGVNLNSTGGNHAITQHGIYATST